MKCPVVRGLIDRRILVNYRVRPEVMRRQLPAPFRPVLVGGWALGGVCLIRLRGVGPRFLPAGIGFSSENAAHRFAVEWDDVDGLHTGVYIPRRDTASKLNTVIGGRLFPGVHHHATFDVKEEGDSYSVCLESDDSTTRLLVEARVAPSLPADSVFDSLEHASDFFECGSIGFSPNADGTCFEGLELRASSWQVEALEVQAVKSSLFDDEREFPPGTVEFDSALLMRGIPHEWHAKGSIEMVAGDESQSLGKE